MQDGKALPNGPVVISPNGLLPSLYREGEILLIYCLFIEVVYFAVLSLHHSNVTINDQSGYLCCFNPFGYIFSYMHVLSFVVYKFHSTISLFIAVIRRAPHEFKIACLEVNSGILNLVSQCRLK